MTASTLIASDVSKPGAREIGLITVGHAMTHWYPATFYLLLPLIGSEFGLTYSQIGFVMACQYAAGALANVPGGMFVDMVGKKGRLMALSLFWVGFPYLLIGFTHAYWMLLVCMVSVGIGNNLWHPTAIPALGRMFPERKGLVLSLHGMGGNAGDALAPLAIGALLTVLTWRQIVVLNVLPGLMMSVLILYFLGALVLAPKHASAHSPLADGQAQSLQSYLQGLKSLLATPGLMMLTASSSFRAMTQGTLMTFLPLYLANGLNLSVFWVGVSMFSMQAAGFIAAPIAGHLSDRVGRRGVLMSSLAMSAVVLLLMVFAAGTKGFVVLVALLGFFLYAVRPILQAWLLESTPKNMGGTSIGILFGMQAAGQSIAPLLGGVVADRFGLNSVFYLLAATIVIANVLVMLMPQQPSTSPA